MSHLPHPSTSPRRRAARRAALCATRSGWCFDGSSRGFPAEPLKKVRRRGRGHADWSWGAAGSRATTGLSAVITSVMALLLLLKPTIAALNVAAHPKESVTFVLGGFAIGSSFYLVHLSMDLQHARWEAELELRRQDFVVIVLAVCVVCVVCVNCVEVCVMKKWSLKKRLAVVTVETLWFGRYDVSLQTPTPSENVPRFL